jgi:PTH1 family peptidyl-tRNA hydrolase
LGNPGKEYERVRHNVGFLFIDALEKNQKNMSLRDISRREKKIILKKTQAFMNESGKAVSNLLKSYKIKPENTLIIHDDIDILWRNSKFSFGRSSAGHKGVESIIKALKTKNFWRLRIGIQPSTKKHLKADKIILKKFTKRELEELKEIIKQAIADLSK